MGRILKFVLPIVILTAGVLATGALVKSRPQVERQRPEPLPPLVRVVVAAKRDVPLSVRAQGTVEPRTETTLVAQVAAEIVWASPSFEVGGFFAAGEELVTLDARDFELAIEVAKARVAQARLRLVEQEAEARVAREEWQKLGVGEADALVLREPQTAEARAGVAAAEAELGKARLDLERTRIRAPFAGRLRAKEVNVGQFLTPGQPVARIHAIDYAEVRLPIPHRELAFLEISLARRNGTPPAQAPRALLSAEFAGRRHHWPGRIVRTEGELDSRTRMLHLVARVEDPYGSRDPERPPLAIGLFVDAEIAGRTVAQAVLLPREALRGEDQVLVVDDEDRLRFRDVEVIRVQGEEAVVDGMSLGTGERVCVSPLDVVVDGMKVRTVEVEGPGYPETAAADPPAAASFESAGAEPAPSAPGPEPEPARPEASAAAVEGPPPARLAASARLLSVDVVSSGETTVVLVAVEGEFESSSFFRLPEPERLFLDLVGVVSVDAAATVEIAEGPISRVRFGQRKVDPRPVSRIVFELKQDVTPRVERVDSGLRVTFE